MSVRILRYALACLFALAAPARADLAVTAPVTVGGGVQAYDLAVPDLGAAVLAFSTANGMWVTSEAAGGTWTDPRRLVRASVSRPLVVERPGGIAGVAWNQGSGLRFAPLLGDGSFGAAETVLLPIDLASGAVAATADGTVVAVGPINGFLTTVVRGAAGVWLPGPIITANAERVVGLLPSTGGLTVAWMSASQLLGADRLPDGNWSPAQPIADGTVDPVVVGDQAGNLLAVWDSVPGIDSAMRPAGTAFWEVSPIIGEARGHAAAFSSDGRFAITWNTADGAGIGFRVGRSDGALSGTQQTRPEPAADPSQPVAVDGIGRVAVLRTEAIGSGRLLRLLEREPTHCFGLAANLTGRATDSGQLGFRAGGTGVAAWRETDATIRAVTFAPDAGQKRCPEALEPTSLGLVPPFITREKLVDVGLGVPMYLATDERAAAALVARTTRGKRRVLASAAADFIHGDRRFYLRPAPSKLRGIRTTLRLTVTIGAKTFGRTLHLRTPSARRLAFPADRR